jgi:hypothetical protein
MENAPDNVVTEAPAVVTAPAGFDREKAAAVVLTWPDDALTTQAARWLWAHLRPDRVWTVRSKGGIDVVRCRVVADLCLKAPLEIEEFVFMDRDMRPDAATEPFLQAAGDVVACEYPIPDMRAWGRPGAMHMGLVRVKRKVLEALAAERDAAGRPIPLFFFPRTADGTRVTACECAWFAERVRKAGFSIVRAGWCGHGN